MKRCALVFTIACGLLPITCASFPLRDENEMNLFPATADMVDWKITADPSEVSLKNGETDDIVREYGIDSAFTATYKTDDSVITYTVYDVGKSYFAYSLARRIAPAFRHDRAVRYFAGDRRSVYYKNNYVIEVSAARLYDNFNSDCLKLAAFLKEKINERPLPGIMSVMIASGEYPVFFPASNPVVSGLKKAFCSAYDSNGNVRRVCFTVSDDIPHASSVFNDLLRHSAGSVLVESDKDRIFYVKESNTFSIFVNSGVFNVVVKGNISPDEGRKNAKTIVKKLESCYEEKY